MPRPQRNRGDQDTRVSHDHLPWSDCLAASNGANVELRLLTEHGGCSGCRSGRRPGGATAARPQPETCGLTYVPGPGWRRCRDSPSGRRGRRPRSRCSATSAISAPPSKLPNRVAAISNVLPAVAVNTLFEVDASREVADCDAGSRTHHRTAVQHDRPRGRLDRDPLRRHARAKAVHEGGKRKSVDHKVRAVHACAAAQGDLAIGDPVQARAERVGRVDVAEAAAGLTRHRGHGLRDGSARRGVERIAVVRRRERVGPHRQRCGRALRRARVAAAGECDRPTARDHLRPVAERNRARRRDPVHRCRQRHRGRRPRPTHWTSPRRSTSTMAPRSTPRRARLPHCDGEATGPPGIRSRRRPRDSPSPGRSYREDPAAGRPAP